MRKFLLLVALLGVALSSCQRESEIPAPVSQDAPPASTAAESAKAEVEAAVRRYLAGRPGLSLENMEIEFGQIQIEGDQAEADVSFRSKSGEGQMSMHYTLVRQDDQWVVQKPAGGHGAGEGQMPPDHPPLEPRSPGSSN